MGCRISTDGDQAKTRFPAPLPVFAFICEPLCPLWIKTPSPDRKRTGPGLAAKRRKRRKKDGATELCLYCFKAGPRKGGAGVSTTIWRTEISGRQNGSGPESSNTDDATEVGIQMKSPSWVDSCLVDGSPLKRPRLFCVSCAFSRLNPALPVSRSRAGFFTADSTENADEGGDFYPQMTQIYTDEGEDREGLGIVSWPGPHLRLNSLSPVVEPWSRSSGAPSFLRILRFFAAKTSPALLRSLLRFRAGCFCRSFLGC